MIGTVLAVSDAIYRVVDDMIRTAQWALAAYLGWKAGERMDKR